MQAGLYPISNLAVYLTAEQLIRANRESIRLGFNRNLNLPEKKLLARALRFPVAQAWRHVGYNGGTENSENVRLLFFCADNPKGENGMMVTLDVTLDMWMELHANPPV